MRTSAGLLCLLVLGMAGCGASSSSAGKFKGEQARVAEAVEELQTSAQRGDAAKLCRDLLTKDLRAQVSATGSSCDKEMEKATDDADAFDLEVTKVEVTGTTAKATVRGEAGDQTVTRVLGMAKEDDRWRIAAFTAGS